MRSGDSRRSPGSGDQPGRALRVCETQDRSRRRPRSAGSRSAYWFGCRARCHQPCVRPAPDRQIALRSGRAGRSLPALFRAHRRTVIAQEGRRRSLAVHLAQEEQRPRRSRQRNRQRERASGRCAPGSNQRTNHSVSMQRDAEEYRYDRRRSECEGSHRLAFLRVCVQQVRM